MILVAGGTGRLGTLLVTRLVDGGNEVRVMTRDPTRAQHLPTTVEVVRGDVRERESVHRAMLGVGTVVSAVHGFAGPGRVTPASVDRDGNATLVDAAATQSARIVLVSGVGAAADSPLELFRAKYEAEQHMRASSAVWTVVRATAFVELWAEIMAKPIVFGRGDNPINFVSVADVAAVVERAVDEESWHGQVVEVGGPENLTFNELAGLLQELRGQQRRIHHVPRPVLRALGVFARQPRAALAMDTFDMSFDGRAAHAAYPDLPLTHVREALGPFSVPSAPSGRTDRSGGLG